MYLDGKLESVHTEAINSYPDSVPKYLRDFRHVNSLC